jgi:hypothetical protein
MRLRATRVTPLPPRSNSQYMKPMPATDPRKPESLVLVNVKQG